MRKCIILTIILLKSCYNYAQSIDNKINLYFGYSFGGFLGKEIIKEGNFISPALYPNYKHLEGFSFKVLDKINPYLSLGLDFANSSSSMWESQEYNDYLNSKIQLYSLCPTIQLHNKFKKTGVLNRIKLFIDIAPTVGLSKLTLINPLFDIQSRDKAISQPKNSLDPFYGVKGNIGLGLAIRQAIGLYVIYSLNHNWITSKLYNDNHFSSSLLGFGAVIRFKKDKYYFTR
jgi:hypothetical protein